MIVVKTTLVTVGDLRRALEGVDDATMVYVSVCEGDFPGYGGHAISAGLENGRFRLVADEQEWSEVTNKDLSAALDDLDDAEEDDG